MTCPGLHCPGCSDGQSLGILGTGAVVLIIADRTVQFVADRIWWIGGTAAACFAVSVAVSMALEAWSDRRGARYAAAHGIMSRADALGAGLVCEVVRDTAREGPPAAPPPQIAPVTIINNFYGADGEHVAARVIRQALAPGQPGAVTDKEK